MYEDVTDRNVLARLVVGVVVLTVVLAVVASGCASSSSTSSVRRAAAPSAASWSLRIERLSGSVVRLGSWRGFPLLGARLQATVCIRSTSEAVYPDGVGITHFEVRRSRKYWFPRRVVVDRPAWLVPFQETWHGRPCGKVTFEDAIPPAYTGGVEALGNPYTCYGVALTIKATIKAGTRRASKRAIIKCGGL